MNEWEFFGLSGQEEMLEGDKGYFCDLTLSRAGQKYQYQQHTYS